MVMDCERAGVQLTRAGIQLKGRALTSVLLAFASLLTACGGATSNSTSSSSNPSGPVTLQIALQPAPPATEAVWNGWVSSFEKAHPSVQVHITYIPAAQYASTILTELQGGGGPDILGTDGGSGEVYSTLPLANSGRLANLSDESWSKDIPSATRSLFGTKGKTFAFPLPPSAAGLIFNQTLLTKWGAQVPTTFSQLLALCTTAKEHGAVAIEVAGANAENTGLLAEIIASSYVYSTQPNWNTLRSQGKVMFAGSSQWTNALGTIGKMNQAGCFEAGAAGMNTPQAEAAVAQGQALAYTAPGLVAGVLKRQNPANDFAVMAFPGPKDANTAVTLSFGDALAVNAKSKAKLDAVQFVNFIAGDAKGTETYASAQSGLTLQQLHNGQVAAPALQPLSPYVKSGKVVSLANTTWASPKVFADLGSGLTGLLTGQSTPTSVLRQMDSDWNSSSSS